MRERAPFAVRTLSRVLHVLAQLVRREQDRYGRCAARYVLSLLAPRGEFDFAVCVRTVLAAGAVSAPLGVLTQLEIDARRYLGRRANAHPAVGRRAGRLLGNSNWSPPKSAHRALALAGFRRVGRRLRLRSKDGVGLMAARVEADLADVPVLRHGSVFEPRKARQSGRNTFRGSVGVAF